MAHERHRMRFSQVETAVLWGQWQTHVAAYPLRSSEGYSQVYGSATIEADYGDLILAAGQNRVAMPYVDVEGRYIRIKTHDPQDPDGSEDAYPWYGIVDHVVRIPDARASNGAGVLVKWFCHGLAAVLDEAGVDNGYELTDNPSPPGPEIITCGYPPGFNQIIGGDRSASEYSSLGVYIFDRSGSDEEWTAKQALAYLIELFANNEFTATSGNQDAITWSLTDNSVLDWTLPPLDPIGMTLAQVLNHICNPARGLGWRVKVESGQPVVEAFSIAPASRTVGGVTIPARTPTALSFDDDAKISRPTFKTDGRRYDIVKAFGQKPVVGITLCYSYSGAGVCSLEPDGWTAATDYPARGDEKTWRRFKLAADWEGDQHDGSDGLRNDLSADGSRDYTASIPSTHGLELVTNLPCREGFTAGEGPRQKPVVVVYDATSGYKQLDVTVRAEGNAVVLGSGFADAVRIYSAIRHAGGLLFVTCACREWAPLQCWHAEDSITWPRDDSPRVAVLVDTNCRQYVILDNTITGVSGGSLTEQSGDLVVQDDIDSLAAQCAAFAASMTSVSGTVKWSQEGTVDPSDYPPGTLINPLTIHGDEKDCYAIISRADVDYRKNTVTWSSERVPQGLEGTP